MRFGGTEKGSSGAQNRGLGVTEKGLGGDNKKGAQGDKKKGARENIDTIFHHHQNKFKQMTFYTKYSKLRH